MCGEVKADFHYFPVNLPDKEEDGTVIPPQESSKLLCAYVYKYQLI